MTEIFSALKDAGFTPGSYGIFGIALMIAAWMAKEWRETRRLSLDDRNARREGYAKQVENLQDENRDLREDQRKLRDEYENYRKLCHNETDSLRALIVELQGDIAGYKRRLDMQAGELRDTKSKADVAYEAVRPLIGKVGQ